MKSCRVGSVKYPIILVDSIGDLDPKASTIQCIAGKKSGFSAYLFQSGGRFNAWAETSTKAAELLAEKINRHEEDCRTASMEVGERNFPVKSRSSLWDDSLKVEREAPLEVVHWWIKGADGEESYKCDIHFLDDDGSSYSFEGVGASLNEALNNLAEACAD